MLAYLSPPGVSLSYTNLLYKEDFLRSVLSRLNLSSMRGRWWDHRVEGVRTEKLNRTYPGEKNTFILLTHARMQSSHAQAHTAHLLAMPYILVRIGAPYEGWWSTPFHLPRNYGNIFKPMIKKKYIFCYNNH